MRNRKAIRLRPSQGGSMARSVGPDDETRARIAATDALVLEIKSRRSGEGSAYITAHSRAVGSPSPYNAPSTWMPLDETLFCDAGDGLVALVIRVDMHSRVLLCEFYYSSGKRKTPPMTAYEDETTGWRELTPDEVRSFRDKIAKAHGEAYEHAI